MTPFIKRMPELYDDVIIWWVDSGAGMTGEQGGKISHLYVNKTHGTVSYIGKDEDIHRFWCREGQHCVCDYIELTMCGSGLEDERCDLAAIQIAAIVKLVIWKGEYE